MNAPGRFECYLVTEYFPCFLFFIIGGAPEKKTWKLIDEILQLVPVIYIEGGKRILILDLLKSRCHPSISSWLSMRETSKGSDVMMGNYLTRLSDMQSRYVLIVHFIHCNRQYGELTWKHNFVCASLSSLLFISRVDI